MTPIDDGSLTRGGAHGARGSAIGGAWFALVFVAVALLVLSGLEHAAAKRLRLVLEDLLSPALGLAMAPTEPLRRLVRHVSELASQRQELERLKDENRRLQGWAQRAVTAERKLVELSELANAVKELPIPFVTARVIADAAGPFVRSLILDAGSEQGVKAGYPVVSADGVVGRVVETGRRTARVLLVTDINSRVPVLIGPHEVRAIAMGDNGPAPRLEHLAASARIGAGDVVATSGHGGLFPRGLRIGTVAARGGGFRLLPSAAIESLGYVSVLMFDNPALGLAGDGGEGRHLDSSSRGPLR